MEELTVHTHEIVEEVIFQPLQIDLVVEFRVDPPHYLVALAIEETK